MDDELVLYSYTCIECAYKGEVHLTGDDHEDEQHNCNACGARVCLQWDGGVTFRLASGKQTDR
jgi:predicted nucleic acid-binding Zn ribbon protein